MRKILLLIFLIIIVACVSENEIAFFRASKSGDLQKVKLLVEKGGVDPNKEMPTGGTALHSAAQKGNLALVKYLIQKGANPNAKVSYISAETYTHTIKGKTYTETSSFSAGDTPLDVAIRNGHGKVAKYLKKEMKTWNKKKNKKNKKRRTERMDKESKVKNNQLR